MSLLRGLADLAFRLSMETAGRRSYDRLIRAADNPREAQARILSEVVRACAGTELGRRYGLASVEGVDDFRARVPISGYEALRGAIARQLETGEPAASPTLPIMYARTSGTTGAPKYIPVTSTTLRRLKRAHRIMAFEQHRSLDAFQGRVLGIGGARCEERLSDGTPAGAATGLIYETMPRLLRAKYVVPPAVFAIEDYDLKYAILARLAGRAGDLSAIATANPSTILRLVELTRASLGHIVRELESGEAPLLTELPAELQRVLRPLRSADARRAATLRPLLQRHAEVTIADLWPELRAVVTWLGGGCAHAAEAVARQLPRGARMIDAGYVGSEMRGTVLVDAERGLALPLLEDVFFEFVSVEDWDRGVRRTLLLHELEEGRDYHAIVSTGAGLLRYHMNDVLRTGPRIGHTPTLSFLRKGRGVTNITGEKLTEDQVHLAMERAARATGARTRFYLFIADAAAGRYRAHVEFEPAHPSEPGSFAAALDAALCALNIEYSGKRASGRLRPAELAWLKPGAGEAYRRHCIESKGQRESQLKLLALQTNEECDFDFAPHRYADAPVPAGVR
jgi:hypothetical protein